MLYSVFTALCPYVITGVVVLHKVRQSYISRTVWPRVSKFYMNLHNHTGQVYSRARYDVNNYFLSEVINV